VSTTLLSSPIVAGTVIRSIVDTGGQECGAIYSPDAPSCEEAQKSRHRYALWRIWEPDRKPLVVIGLNPSTATELVLDNTCRRDIQYARDWGYGGLIKLNLFSFRATDPSVMRSWYEAMNSVEARTSTINDAHLQWFCDPERAGLILCAWGSHGSLFRRSDVVRGMLTSQGCSLFALALTKGGEPRHTLYLRSDLKPVPYNLRSYPEEGR
jgi:hypothetical protein